MRFHFVMRYAISIGNQLGKPLCVFNLSSAMRFHSVFRYAFSLCHPLSDFSLSSVMRFQLIANFVMRYEISLVIC